MKLQRSPVTPGKLGDFQNKNYHPTSFHRRGERLFVLLIGKFFLVNHLKYANNLTSQLQPRIETFANTSMLNRNGLKPAGAVVGPDDRGLWWPTLPPRPSVDEVEQHKRPQEEAGKPGLVKDVKYKLTYGVGNALHTLPTNYEVYRQVVKAYPQKTPLELTLGMNDNSVEKAEPVSK